MSVNLVLYPSPTLTVRARELTPQELSELKVDGGLLELLLMDMTEAMIKGKGVGLAAPQVGLSLRVIVYRTAAGVQHLINPKVIKASIARLPELEGCLSLPGFRAYVMRHRVITVEGYTMLGKVTVKAEHDDARVIQHEIDHLDGKLITDRVGVLDQERAKAFLEQMAHPVSAEVQLQPTV